MAAAGLALAVLTLAPDFPVVADTETVGVSVVFVERIEIARAMPGESGDVRPARDLAGGARPGSDARDESFVTALSIEATPRRAITFHVGAPESADSSPFLCSYGSVRMRPCDGAGLAAVSLGGAELRIDRGGAAQEEGVQSGAARGDRLEDEPADIEITIAYQ